MSFRWEIIIIFFGSPIHWRSQHVPRGGTCHTWKTKLLGKKKSLTLNHIYIWETCVLMGPFGKYMVFRTQLYEIWKPAFHVESYIFFMHSEPTTYFVPRLSPGLVIFQNYPFYSFFFSSHTRHPPLSPSLLSEIDQHFAGVITDRRSHLSPIGNLPPSLLPFHISLSFILFRHHQDRERGKEKGERRRFPACESCEQRPMMKLTKCRSKTTTGGGDGGELGSEGRWCDWVPPLTST